MITFSFPRIKVFVTFFGVSSYLVTISSKILCKVVAKSSSVPGSSTYLILASAVVLVVPLWRLYSRSLGLRCPPRSVGVRTAGNNVVIKKKEKKEEEVNNDEV